MKTTLSALLVALSLVSLGFADETSFNRIDVPDSKGRQIKAVLTFSDDDKAVEVKPIKGDTISIPYSEIYKFSYEYTKRHRVNEESIFAAAVGVGAIVMLTHSKSHWLEIDYRGGRCPQVVRLADGQARLHPHSGRRKGPYGHGRGSPGER